MPFFYKTRVFVTQRLLTQPHHQRLCAWLPALILTTIVVSTLLVTSGQVDAAPGEADLSNDIPVTESFDDGLNANDEFATSYQFDDTLDDGLSLWDRVRSGFAMPDVNSTYTSKHEQWYASRPDYVSRMLDRSKKYLFHIVEEVEKRGMPTEIALLPMIESGFNPKALSTSKASGLWQFIPSTGKDFGLKQNYWKDSRKDIKAGTQAALTYLQRLHGMFGSWDLALAAYNAGEGTVAKAIEKNRRLGLPTDYEHLSLPDETRNYVPKLQAIKNIIFRPDNYGLTLNEIPNRPYFSTVNAPRQIDTKLAAELAGISQEEFIALNPSYNKPVMIVSNDMQQLLLPTFAASNFVRNLSNYDKPLSQWKSYRPARGERIQSIADRFNISVYELCAINNMRPNKNLLPRRTLLVPGNVNGHLTQAIDVSAMANYNLLPREEVVASPSSVTHHVKTGDTLAKLARKYGVSASMIMKSNGLKKQRLSPGQILHINLPGRAASARTRAKSHASRNEQSGGRHKSETSSKSSRHSRVSSHASQHHASTHRETGHTHKSKRH